MTAPESFPMPRNPSRVPSYRLHRASGQAVVTLNGRDCYLGRHNTPESRAAYDRLVGEWQARGRVPPDQGAYDLTVSQLILCYWKFAEGHYRKDGQPTSQLLLIKRALRVLREMYGAEAASRFGPLALQAVRRKFVEAGLARETCNANVARIKRLFRWGTEQELIPPSVWHALRSVSGLAKGRTEAPDHPPVGPVPAAHVEAILPFLRPPLAAMVRIQDLTGMRPGEVVIMRGCDIDRSGPVWRYVPHSHKTEHRGRGRTILIGPKAQEVLAPWLTVGPQEYLFRPRPLPDQPRKGRARQGKWSPGRRYDARAYGARVRSACRQAGVEPFSPNRLRHSAGTRIRQRYGLEAAQTVLGHARADVTQLYAERDLAKAQTVIAEIG
jgi:integrase